MSGLINNNISVSNNLVNCRPHGDCEIIINDNLADDSRKIFVGGLSWETNEEDLKKYFSEFGEVKSCIIKLDRYTNHSRGFGFVIFDSEDTVNKILERKEHVLNKKKIDPKKAKPSREPQRKIFIGGLDPDLSDMAIREYFSQFGEIENIETPFDIRKNKRKAYIFVTFANENEARKAALREFQEINGKKFEVRIAIPREQANKGKNILDWKGTSNSSFYPYSMLPYMYPEYFYYMYNNPQLLNNYYNPYDLMNYDPLTLSRQLSTGLMINNNPQQQSLSSTQSSSNTRLKSLSGNYNSSKYNSNTNVTDPQNISPNNTDSLPTLQTHQPNGVVSLSIVTGGGVSTTAISNRVTNQTHADSLTTSSLSAATAVAALNGASNNAFDHSPVKHQ